MITVQQAMQQAHHTRIARDAANSKRIERLLRAHALGHQKALSKTRQAPIAKPTKYHEDIARGIFDYEAPAQKRFRSKQPTKRHPVDYKLRFVITKAHREKTRRLLIPLVGSFDQTAFGPQPTIAYELIDPSRIDEIIGATTTVPTNQTMLDVYNLLTPIVGVLLGSSEFPMPIGAEHYGRTITVICDSPADKALSGFPTLMRKIYPVQFH